MESNNIEFLPVIHKDTGETYYALHVIRILDAVDYNNSIFEKLSTGLIIGFEKTWFNPNVVKDVDIFMIYLNGNVYSTSVYVSDDFRNSILNSDLRGFEFVEVWDSEK